ncbi:hypothetical protein B0H67DRAFT_298966 [Lasiosphaeris hirsuta]|uniref:Uncharacterized protein n=1 Tax=Lasiosphaeris hirsuta TaxID=260670 RepID=A0AA40DSH1_9PEZI|nr:hypothetical protein B0H67DRAFT_298966 [Lasiosphaeris hirsuta]
MGSWKLGIGRRIEPTDRQTDGPPGEGLRLFRSMLFCVVVACFFASSRVNAADDGVGFVWETSVAFFFSSPLLFLYPFFFLLSFLLYFPSLLLEGEKYRRSNSLFPELVWLRLAAAVEAGADRSVVRSLVACPWRAGSGRPGCLLRSLAVVATYRGKAGRISACGRAVDRSCYPSQASSVLETFLSASCDITIQM